MSYFKGPDIAVELPEYQPNTSVLKLYAEALRQNGESVALIEGQTGKTATFKDLLQQSTSITAGLRGAGVTAGDYVIICCEKSITAYSSLLGTIFTGATAVVYPLPHADSVPQLTMGYSIKAVICDIEYAESLRKSMKSMNPQPVLFATTDSEDNTLKKLLTAKGELEIYEVKDVRTHVPMIFYSSGTTGDPKGIKITDIGVQLTGRFFNAPIDTFLCYSPFYWLSSLVTITSAIFKNFIYLSSNSSNARDNLELIQKYKVTVLFAGTGSVTKYLNEPSLKNIDISSLEGVAIGGEVLLTSVAEEFRRKVLNGKLKLLTGYGSTEAGLVCNLEVKPDDGPFEYGLCGKLNAGVEIKIIDDSRKAVSIGSLGQVWVKSPGQTTGYWGRPELNKEVFDEDGFFQTGDVGFFNTQGQIFIRGRVGDLINFKGEKISPSEVEDIIMSHEAVLEAAVVGKPHPTDIQHVTAYVVLKKGFTLLENDLQSFVDGRVPDKMKLRGGVHFLDILPRTIIGKVKRKVLREM